MINKIIFLILLTGILGSVKAQSILLERDINESVYVKKKGPNKARFMHLYYDFSPYFNLDKDAPQYKQGNSFRTYIGLRNYYRLANSYIMGFEVEFGWEDFKVKQNNQKTFPSIGEHKKETLNTTNAGLNYFNRILLTQRESSLGIWFDAGIYSNLTLVSRHVTKDKAAPSEQYRIHKETDKGLEYVNPWEFGLKVRLGLKRYAITGTYRLSKWLSGINSSLEPPKVSLGLELGLY